MVPIPLIERGRRRTESGARHDQYLAIGLKSGGTIGGADRNRKIRTRFPLTRVRIEDRGVAGAALIGADIEDGAIRAQYRWPELETRLLPATAGCRGIPQLHDRAAGRAPNPRGRVENLRASALRVVSTDVCI